MSEEDLKKILCLGLLPITLLLYILESAFILIYELSLSMSNIINNVVDENYEYLKDKWLRIRRKKVRNENKNNIN